MSNARVLNRQTLMWLPAAALLTAALLAAAGFRVTQPSHAASSTTTVSASVGPELHIGTGAGQCGGASFSGVSIVTGSATNLGACTLSFGTNNNTAGANLAVESTRPSGGLEVFCQAAMTSGCAAGATSFTSVAVAGGASIANGQYGVQVTAAPSSSNATAACAAVATSVWVTSGNYYGVRSADTAGAGDPVCNRAGTGDTSIPIQFTAQGDAAKTAGTYLTDARFTVAAN